MSTSLSETPATAPLLDLRQVSRTFGSRPDLAARIAIALGAAHRGHLDIPGME